jgi:hypothetical protein
LSFRSGTIKSGKGFAQVHHCQVYWLQKSNRRYTNDMDRPILFPATIINLLLNIESLLD